MIVRYSKPEFPLSKYIDSIYAYIGSSGGIARKLIPDGKTDLMFNFNSDLSFYNRNNNISNIGKSLVQGVRKEPFTFIFGKYINIIGVRFLPLGFSKLLKISEKELQFDYKPFYAEDVIGKQINELEEKIFAENCPDKKISLIQQWLFGLFREKKSEEILITGAVQTINRTGGIIPVNQVCNNSGGLYKKIQRAFHNELGISPKLYSRMIRFENIHTELRNLRKVDWMSLVSRYNFYDHSHLIKEFKLFSGTTPEEFHSNIALYV